MDVTNKIYRIKRPDNAEIVYVGKTKIPLEQRLLQHINDCANIAKSEYLKDLVNQGQIPIIELIAEAPDNEVDFVERKWIRHYSLLGQCCLNATHKISEPIDANHELFEKIGARLRELRKARGYTNHDIFAYDHALDRTQYSKYERGADMRISSLIKVLDALDISPAEFFKDFK